MVIEARQWQERGVAVADDEDSETSVTLLHGFGISVLQQAEVGAAVALFDRSLEMARRLGRRDLEGRAFNDLGIARRQSGDYAEAMRLLQESLAIARETDSSIYEATALSNLVVIYIDVGQYADAAQAAHEAMVANERNGDAWGVAIDRLNYTAAILKSEGPRAAHDRYVEWADGIASFRDKELSIDLMELGASIVAGLGEPILAARLLAGADTQRATIHMPRSAAEENLMDEWMSAARSSIPESEWAQAYAAGQDLAPEPGIELVQALGPDEGERGATSARDSVPTATRRSR